MSEIQQASQSASLSASQLASQLVNQSSTSFTASVTPGGGLMVLPSDLVIPDIPKVAHSATKWKRYYQLIGSLVDENS